MLEEKRFELGSARDRLWNGLQKLDETNELVANMKIELGELQPVLKESRRHEIFVVQVAKDKEEAALVEAKVAEEEAVAKKQADETKAIADSAQADLDEAMPALDSAVKSLNALNKADIVEVKGFPKPPPLVRMTIGGVCLLLGEKDIWDAAKKVLSKGDFMSLPFEYDKDHIKAKIVKALTKYVDNKEYTPENVAKQSKAAMSLVCGRAPCTRTAAWRRLSSPSARHSRRRRTRWRDIRAQLKAAQDKLQAKTTSPRWRRSCSRPWTTSRA